MNKKQEQIIRDLLNVQTRFESAVASDFHSRAAYVGRVQQTEKVTIFAEDGTPFEKEVCFTVSWDSISKILGLVRERAGLENPKTQIEIPENVFKRQEDQRP